MSPRVDPSRLVVVAMSGGVDSSVAAGLLAEAGHRVVGVHMRLHDADPKGAGHCCGLDDAMDARRVAAQLGIPFHVLDLREAFRRAVVDDFARAWRDGITPNPCVACNGVLKFDVLWKRARALGAEALATGHYARVGPDGELRAAVDEDKDQSYFLWPVRREVLKSVWFPLGGLTKPEVREHARRLGLLTAEKAESQEICFLPDGDRAGLLQASHPEVSPQGEVVHEDGRVLGSHQGYWRFTVGQRRGLGVAAGAPLYVHAVDASRRRVVVGGRSGLMHRGLEAGGLVWGREPSPEQVLQVRIRHRGERVPGRVDGGRVTLERPVWAVAPGQSVVFYDGDEVLGGGVIRRGLALPEVQEPSP